MSDPRPDGVAEYGSFLREQLAAEDSRKTSLEQRGLAVITTSGALVTLLFALAALSTKKEPTFELTGGAEMALGISLAFFVGAAICALVTNVPLPYHQVKPAQVEGRLDEDPVRSEHDALRDIAKTRATELKSARRMNGIKANLLLVAMALEVAAVVAVAVAVWAVLSPL